MFFSAATSQHQFLSTLPVRGATRPLRAAGLCPHISIHAPREGSDVEFVVKVLAAKLFLSTLPVRGATRHGLIFIIRCWHFYPRSP